MKRVIIGSICTLLLSGSLIRVSAQEAEPKNDSSVIVLTEEAFNLLDESGLNGEYHLMYPSGSIQEVRIYNNGHLDGTWIQYNEKQVMIAVASYKNDLKDGKWMIWDDNGVKRYEMEYKAGARTGTWYSWDEKGTLISERSYETPM